MTNRKTPSLRSLLLALVLLSLSPCLILLLHTDAQQRVVERREALDEALRILRLVGGRLDDLMGNAELVLEVMEASGISNWPDKGTGQPGTFNIMLVSPDGEITRSARPLDAKKRYTPMPWLLRARATHKMTTHLSPGIIFDGPSLFAARPKPLKAESDPKATGPKTAAPNTANQVLALEFPMSFLGRFTTQAQLPTDSTVVICDRFGTILYRYPDNKAWRGKVLQDQQLTDIKGDSGEWTARDSGLDGMPRLYGFRRLTTPGGSEELILRVGVPEGDVMASADNRFTDNMFGVGLAAMIALGIALLYSNHFILKPVQAMLEAAEKIRCGDLKARAKVKGKFGELSRMATTFNGMAEAMASRETEREQAQAAVHEGVRRVQALINATTESFLLLDRDCRLLTLNQEAARRRGMSVNELEGTYYFDTLPHEVRQSRKEKTNRVLDTGRPVFFEEESGGRHYRISLYPVPDEHGRTVQLASFSADITRQKQAQKSLNRANRALMALSHSNQAVIFATDEGELASNVCRIMVETGDYGAAWVGLAGQDQDKTVHPLAWHGISGEAITSAAVCWNETAHGQGPAGTAIRSGRNIICQDAASDPSLEPWRELFTSLDVHGVISLPLMKNSAPFGVLSIWAKGQDAFDPDEISLLTNVAENLAYGLAAIQNRQERLRTQAALQRAEEQYRTMIENSPVGIYQATPQPNGRYVKVNEAFARIFGFESPAQVLAEITDTSRQLYADPIRREELHQELSLNNSVNNFEALSRRQDGTTFWTQRTVRAVRDDAGRIICYDGFVTDITDRKRAQDKLSHQAWHDDLTDLPNRSMFMDRLHSSLEQAASDPNHVFAMVFLDLDDFKLINDGFGHMVGDRMLQMWSSRLRRCLGPNALAARFGGDEFAVLIDKVFDRLEALRVADAVHSALAPPFTFDGYEVRMTASMGVVVGNSRYSTAEDVLRDADIAMYQAKAKGQGMTKVFDRHMRKQVLKRVKLENELHKAMNNGGLFLAYQPYFKTDSMELAGYEALVRWQHPERGIVSPGEFIPVAEDSGLIIELGQFVLDEACAQMRKWLDLHPKNDSIFMNVNLSGKQFFQADPIDQVRRALDGSGLNPARLKAEITESVLMEDMAQAVHVLHGIKDMGVKISLDDFGTGYSSLGYLRSFPLDSLKMDRSFVSRLDRDDKDAQIVRIIVDLAHALDMEVIAEGIENKEVLNQLANMRCDCAQGFYMSRPVPAPEAEAFLFKDWKELKGA